MYAIHTTPGFIIESRPSGEAGKLLSIFTRDLGLVWAVAQGIRLEKSKLRYHAQEYSFGEFSFVRGKEFWRLTSTGALVLRRSILRNDSTLRSDLSFSDLIARIALLLRRLLHGEEAHPELFEHIEASFLFLENPTNLANSTHYSTDSTHTKDPTKLSAEQMQTLESIIVFRILHLLGYIGVDKNLDARLVAEPLSIKLLDETVGQRMDVNRHINKALRESHL